MNTPPQVQILPSALNESESRQTVIRTRGRGDGALFLGNAFEQSTNYDIASAYKGFGGCPSLAKQPSY